MHMIGRRVFLVKYIDNISYTIYIIDIPVKNITPYLHTNKQTSLDDVLYINYVIKKRDLKPITLKSK